MEWTSNHGGALAPSFTWMEIVRPCAIYGRHRHEGEIIRVGGDIFLPKSKARPATPEQIEWRESIPAVDDLADKHKGQAGIILGGGPSLPSDFEKAPEGVLFGINHHAPRIVDCDYLVFNDRKMKDVMAPFPGVKLSIHLDQSDYDLTYKRNMGISSIQAAVLASMMGCDPIILCGMDCYQGEMYFHETDQRPSGANQPLSYHLKKWGQIFTECSNPSSVRAVSGPLVEVFGQWQ